MSPASFSDCMIRYEGASNRLVLAWGGPDGFRLSYDPWENGLGMRYWRDERWVPSAIDPNFSLLRPGLSLNLQNPLRRFNLTIPPELIPVIEPFQHYQYTCMRLLQRNPRALHMAIDTPVLLALLCEEAQDRDWPDWEVDRLLLCKRESILDRIVHWSPRWAVRLVSKLHLGMIDEHMLFLVRRMLSREDVARYLTRFKNVTRDMLRDALQAEEFLDCRLLRKVSHDPTEAKLVLRSVASLAWSTVHMGEAVYEPDIAELVWDCGSLSHLRRLHHEMEQQYDLSMTAGVEALFGDGAFDDPPFPGNENIVPITTVKDLVQEGFDMEHCVGTYASAVFDRAIYIYKVLAPERATLAIANPYMYPSISELLADGNQPVAETTWEAVKDWLRDEITILE